MTVFKSTLTTLMEIVGVGSPEDKLGIKTDALMLLMDGWVGGWIDA